MFPLALFQAARCFFQEKKKKAKDAGESLVARCRPMLRARGEGRCDKGLGLSFPARGLVPGSIPPLREVFLRTKRVGCGRFVGVFHEIGGTVIERVPSAPKNTHGRTSTLLQEVTFAQRFALFSRFCPKTTSPRSDSGRMLRDVPKAPCTARGRALPSQNQQRQKHHGQPKNNPKTGCPDATAMGTGQNPVPTVRKGLPRAKWGLCRVGFITGGGAEGSSTWGGQEGEGEVGCSAGRQGKKVGGRPRRGGSWCCAAVEAKAAAQQICSPGCDGKPPIIDSWRGREIDEAGLGFGGHGWVLAPCAPRCSQAQN